MMPVMIQSLSWVVSIVCVGGHMHTADVGMLRREEPASLHQSRDVAVRVDGSDVVTELNSDGHVRMDAKGHANLDLHDQLDRTLAGAGLIVTEGHAQPNAELIQAVTTQITQRKASSTSSTFSTVCEVGFKTGHTALHFLKNTQATLYEFDSGDHAYVKKAADLLKSNFPGRLNSVWGNSLTTLPKFTSLHPDVQCDLMIIDAGHDYAGAAAHLQNFAKMATATHALALQEKPCDATHCQGAAKAWQELVEQGCIEKGVGMNARSGHSVTVGRYTPCSLWPQIGSQGYSLMEIQSKGPQAYTASIAGQ
jgi:hypothetical protein